MEVESVIKYPLPAFSHHYSLNSLLLWAHWATKEQCCSQKYNQKATLMRLVSENQLNSISQNSAAMCHFWNCHISGYDFWNWLNNNNNNKNGEHLVRKEFFSIPMGLQVLQTQNGVNSEKDDGIQHINKSSEDDCQEKRYKLLSKRQIVSFSFFSWSAITLDFHLLKEYQYIKNRLLCPTVGRSCWVVRKIDLAAMELRFSSYWNGSKSPWHTFSLPWIST